MDRHVLSQTDRLSVVFSIPNLEPGNSYTGPTGTGDDNDLCKCNTVVYSLMSACDACQGAKWFSCVFRLVHGVPGRSGSDFL